MAAAAAVVMGQVVLATWYDAYIQIIDDKTALLRGVLPGTGRNLSDVAVLKIDDCRFEATSSGSAGNKLAMINIGVLSDEYRQWRDNITGGLRTAIIGTGKGAAICSSVGNRCFNDLILGMGGVSTSPEESAWRALKAVSFLQKYCPPQPLGF